MPDTNGDQLLRYRRGQRIIHAVMAGSFLILLFTGLALVWSPLAFIAAGGWSRYLHRIAAIGFMSVPILYLVFDRAGAKEIVTESFKYDSDDVAWFKKMYRYVLGRTAEMPPQGRLNAGQKLHHAGVVVMSAGIVVSGLILWFAKGMMGPEGLAITAMVHDVTMLALTILLVGHLYFTFVYKALSGMTRGYVDVDEARLEHAKWVEELEHEAAAAAEEEVTEKV